MICVTASKDGQYAISGSRDQSVRIWNIDPDDLSQNNLITTKKLSVVVDEIENELNENNLNQSLY